MMMMLMMMMMMMMIITMIDDAIHNKKDIEKKSYIYLKIAS
jgi:hypothetical protein